MITIINFKTYKQGKQVIDFAKRIQRVDKSIIVGVQASDIKEVADKTKLKVYSQHVDYFERGRNTGFVLPESIKTDGAAGTFLNHSEHRLKFDVLKKTIKRCKKLKLKTAVFAGDLHVAKRIEKLHPDLLIVEPPKLVGGKISVSTAKPELIKEIAKKIRMKFLVGAGIHNQEDVRVAMRLGASGIAVSSSVMTSKNPEKVLRELLGK